MKSVILLLIIGVALCVRTAKSAPIRRAERELVAAVLIAEAGGEPGSNAMPAVLEVVWNRSRFMDASLTRVVTADRQFSCLNSTTPEELVLRAKQHPRWSEALRLARRAPRTRLTGGALYYHRDSISPEWARSRKPTAWIGRHKFYGRLQ